MEKIKNNLSHNLSHEFKEAEKNQMLSSLAKLIEECSSKNENQLDTCRLNFESISAVKIYYKKYWVSKQLYFMFLSSFLGVIFAFSPLPYTFVSFGALGALFLSLIMYHPFIFFKINTLHLHLSPKIAKFVYSQIFKPFSLKLLILLNLVNFLILYYFFVNPINLFDFINPSNLPKDLIDLFIYLKIDPYIQFSNSFLAIYALLSFFVLLIINTYQSHKM